MIASFKVSLFLAFVLMLGLSHSLAQTGAVSSVESYNRIWCLRD